jgi:hypothetical protein
MSKKTTASPRVRVAQQSSIQHSTDFRTVNEAADARDAAMFGEAVTP